MRPSRRGFAAPQDDDEGWAAKAFVMVRSEASAERLEPRIAPAASAPWTVFARAEQVDQAELAPGNIYTVRKVSLGAIHDWRLSDDIKIGVGALINGFDIPSPLSASYGDTGGGMAFVRLKIG